jgi:DNA-binding NtrC family response regulator
VTSARLSGNHNPNAPLKRLLFVDDEPNIRATLPTILRRYGFTVAVAGTVAQALDKIKTEEFGLLLCDLNIESEGDGFNVVRAMREKNPDCVSIILTGYPALETAVDGIHLGIDDYLMKPTNADALVALLAEKLAKRATKGRVLTVAYDETLLQTWALLLKAQGYDAVVSKNLESLRECCKEQVFDVLLLGSSVPLADKASMIEAFRRCCPAPIINVISNPDGEKTDGADFHIAPDPEKLLQCIAEAISRKSAARNGAA